MDHVLDGFNALVLVYGSSGTGKGHAFHGTDSEAGLLLSAATHLFRAISSSPSTSALLTLSAYHVHGNHLIDLLAPSTLSPLLLPSLPTPSSPPPALCSLPFSSPADLSTLLAQLRATARALSLRSPHPPTKPHLVCDLRLHLTRPPTTHSTLTRFISCAGSGGASLKFSPGLTALSQVTAGLASGRAAYELPFTHSTLTRLTEFALAGAGYVAALLCVDSTDAAHEDTAHALSLAAQLGKVPLKPQPQRSRTAERLAEVREEIAGVRSRLAAGMAVGGVGVDPRDVERLKRLCGEVEAVKAGGVGRVREEGERWRKVRLERLRKEGLTHVLLTPTPVPQSLTDATSLLLRDLVLTQAALEDAQAEVERLGGEGGEVVEEVVGREAELRERVDALEAEYRQAMAQVVAIEADQRRVWRGAGDDAALSRYHRGHSWAAMRSGMASDAVLAGQVQALEESAALIAQSFAGKAAGGEGGVAGVVADAGQLTAEWLEVSRQAAVVAWERDRLLGRVWEERVRAAVEREREREEALQLMTEYREQVEAEKRTVEGKYRTLLTEAVNDALRWSEEAAQLRAQLEQRRR